MHSAGSVRLSDVADIRSSNVDKLSVEGELDVQLCNYMDVYSNERITSSIDFMRATATPVECARFRVERGDVLMTKDSETPDDIGVPAVVTEDIPGLVCGYHLALLKPDAAKVDPGYLSKWIGSTEAAAYFARVATGSTRFGLTYSAIANTPVRLPPLVQQRRAAEVLFLLDEAIEHTESMIAKTQQIKAGLMHDLFTRGVTADGQLRPPREDAPEFYEDSPLGWVPRGWSAPRLGSLLAETAVPMRSGPFGSALLKEELVESGIPLLGIDNVHPEKFVPTYRRFVPLRKFAELRRYAVFPGDVIITIMGTVGRCCVYPGDAGPALSSKHLWTMTFDQSQVLPELVCWQLGFSAWVRTWFLRHSQGGVMEAIQSSTLRNVRLRVPPLPEQERIRERYMSLNALLHAEERSLGKLRRRRAGLMHDLLSGSVRVSEAV